MNDGLTDREFMSVIICGLGDPCSEGFEVIISHWVAYVHRRRQNDVTIHSDWEWGRQEPAPEMIWVYYWPLWHVERRPILHVHASRILPANKKEVGALTI